MLNHLNEGIVQTNIKFDSPLIVTVILDFPSPGGISHVSLVPEIILGSLHTFTFLHSTPFAFTVNLSTGKKLHPETWRV